MYWSDTGMGALEGAGSGAAIGSAFGLPGVAIGGGVGALAGGIGGYFKGKAKSAQKQSIATAKAKLEEFARQQRQQRMADMDKAMSYFAPVQSELTRLYG